jgi:hypothetical protein
MPAKRFASIDLPDPGRGGNFQSAFRRGLPAHIAEIGDRLAGSHGSPRNRHKGLEMLGILEVSHDLRQVAHSENADSFGDPGFGRVAGGDHKVQDAVLPRTGGDGEHSPNRAQCPIERQLPDQQMLVGARHHSHGSQNSDCHGQIEAGALFPHVGRSEVDRDGFVGVAEPGVQ